MLRWRIDEITEEVWGASGVHRNVTSYTISKQGYVVHYMDAFHAEVAASLGLAASIGVYGTSL